MEKHRADRLITVYRDRIFGFALSKTGNISQAEELASDIVCEVYKAFLILIFNRSVDKGGR